MKAIDTNVVIRIVTRDDPVQAEMARKAVLAGEVLLPATVALESFWVLRNSYGLDRMQAVETLRRFASLETVVPEDAAALMLALDRVEEGFDFADALHLAAAADCEAFLTFDRRLIRRAGHVPRPGVQEP